MDAVSEDRAGVVLLADDDPLVRKIMSRTLERAGLEVLAAATDTEALALFREHAERIDVAILDVGLEDRGGPATLEEMLAIAPGFGILFSSGHFPDAELALRLESWDAQFLAKPFRVGELREIVTSLMESRAS